MSPTEAQPSLEVSFIESIPIPPLPPATDSATADGLTAPIASDSGSGAGDLAALGGGRRRQSIATLPPLAREILRKRTTATQQAQEISSSVAVESDDTQSMTPSEIKELILRLHGGDGGSGASETTTTSPAGATGGTRFQLPVAETDGAAAATAASASEQPDTTTGDEPRNPIYARRLSRQQSMLSSAARLQFRILNDPYRRADLTNDMLPSYADDTVATTEEASTGSDAAAAVPAVNEEEIAAQMARRLSLTMKGQKSRWRSAFGSSGDLRSLMDGATSPSPSSQPAATSAASAAPSRWTLVREALIGNEPAAAPTGRRASLSPIVPVQRAMLASPSALPTRLAPTSVQSKWRAAFGSVDPTAVAAEALEASLRLGDGLRSHLRQSSEYM